MSATPYGQCYLILPKTGMRGVIRNRTPDQHPFAEGTPVEVLEPVDTHQYWVRDDAGNVAVYQHWKIDCGLRYWLDGEWHISGSVRVLQWYDSELWQLQRQGKGWGDEAKTLVHHLADLRWRPETMSLRQAIFEFSARRKRRGAVVIITGRVQGPPGAVPYLIEERITSPRERSFRLAFRGNNGQIPWEPLPEFEHLVAHCPPTVTELRIHLPNEDVFTIRHDAS